MSTGQPWQLKHIAVVVRDMDQAIQHYSSLGLCPSGAFRIWQGPMHAIYKGRPISTELKLATARMGEMQLELFEARQGDNPFWDFFQEKGEGVHHLGFVVADLEAEVARAKEQGIRVLLSGQAGRMKFAYLDTAATGGAYMELMQTA